MYITYITLEINCYNLFLKFNGNNLTKIPIVTFLHFAVTNHTLNDLIACYELGTFETQSNCRNWRNTPYYYRNRHGERFSTCAREWSIARRWHQETIKLWNVYICNDIAHACNDTSCTKFMRRSRAGEKPGSDIAIPKLIGMLMNNKLVSLARGVSIALGTVCNYERDSAAGILSH